MAHQLDDLVERYSEAIHRLAVPYGNKKCRRYNGSVFFTVMSDGTTGADWFNRLKAKDYHVDPCREMFDSKNFVSTTSIKAEICAFSIKNQDSGSGERETRVYVETNGLKMNVEFACLIRDMFTDKEYPEIGLWWSRFILELAVSGGFYKPPMPETQRHAILKRPKKMIMCGYHGDE